MPHPCTLPLRRRALCVILSLASAPALADGMQPQSTIIILDEAIGEVAMNVTNTDTTPSLLHTVVLDIPEDTDTVVIATPPVARVEPGQLQMVRFMLQGPPLRTQRLKRVTFEGIGHSISAEGKAVVGIGVRQNLPMLLHPKGLQPNKSPWTLLQWQRQGDTLAVVNDSAYVIRMAQSITSLPSGTLLELPRSYLLAGETLSIALPPSTRGDLSVRIEPASVYGFAVGTFEAPVR